MEEVKDLTKTFQPDLVIIESGGDNLAANYSRELADYIIYVIDVAGNLYDKRTFKVSHFKLAVISWFFVKTFFYGGIHWGAMQQRRHGALVVPVSVLDFRSEGWWFKPGLHHHVF